MTISYAVTVCNEFIEIQRLLPFLIQNINKGDAITIVYDSNNGTAEVYKYLEMMVENHSDIEIGVHTYDFKGHFSDLKNYLTSKCTKDFIFNIDADEVIDPEMVEILPQILDDNDVDVYLVPRINTVGGITQEHIQKWGWRIDSKNRINFPDMQMRVYRNNNKIKWKNKVHEVLTGYKTLASLPTDDVFCLIHDKTVDKQVKQNDYYNTL